eukprot:tig00000204_g17678.t1
METAYPHAREALKVLGGAVLVPYFQYPCTDCAGTSDEARAEALYCTEHNLPLHHPTNNRPCPAKRSQVAAARAAEAAEQQAQRAEVRKQWQTPAQIALADAARANAERQRKQDEDRGEVAARARQRLEERMQGSRPGGAGPSFKRNRSG